MTTASGGILVLIPGLAVAVRGGESVLLSIQLWLCVKSVKSKKNEEFPPSLPLVSVGASITEAKKSLKLKSPSF